MINIQRYRLWGWGSWGCWGSWGAGAAGGAGIDGAEDGHEQHALAELDHDLILAADLWWKVSKACGYRVGAGRRMHEQGIAHQLAPRPCRQATQCAAATGQAKPCQVNQRFRAPREGPEPGAAAAAKAGARLRPEPMAGA